MKKLVGLFVGVLVLAQVSVAEAAFTPREWVKGGVNVVAGVVSAVDETAEGLWDSIHGSILHPLGTWGRNFINDVVSIGEPSA